MRYKSIIFNLLAGLIFSATAQAATYTVDPDHTAVSFKIRHLFSNVQGSFNKFEGTIDYEPGKPDTWPGSGQTRR